MAHVKKFKRKASGLMIGHYERSAEKDGFVRGNIDPVRIHLNKSVGFTSDSPEELADAIRKKIEEGRESHVKASGKKLRSDAVVLVDWVVTLPQDCPESLTGTFFETVVDFIKNRYGADKVLGGFLHMDESTPHIHVPIIPIRDGKFQASYIVTRTDMKSFHDDLGRAVDEVLGMHVSIKIDEIEEGKKKLSKLKQKDYIKAKAALEATEQELAAARDEVAQERELLGAMMQDEQEINERIHEAQAHEEALLDRLEHLRQAEARESSEEAAGDTAATSRDRKAQELESLVALTAQYEHESRSGKLAILTQLIEWARAAIEQLRSRIEQVRTAIEGIKAQQAQQVPKLSPEQGIGLAAALGQVMSHSQEAPGRLGQVLDWER